jgi:hypothetical protein
LRKTGGHENMNFFAGKAGHVIGRKVRDAFPSRDQDKNAGEKVKRILLRM